MQNYNVLKRLSNILRKCGKRTKADQLIIDTALILKQNGVVEPYRTRADAIEVLKPRVELRSQKKSGQSVQVPSAMTTSRQEGRAIRRLKQATKDRRISNSRGKSPTLTNTREGKRGGPTTFSKVHPKGFAQARALEIRGILRGEGSQALIRRDTLHRRAIAQRGVRRGT